MKAYKRRKHTGHLVLQLASDILQTTIKMDDEADNCFFHPAHHNINIRFTVYSNTCVHIDLRSVSVNTP